MGTPIQSPYAPAESRDGLAAAGHVWRGLLWWLVLLSGFTAVGIFLQQLFQPAVPAAVNRGLGMFFVLLPVLIWLGLSLYPDQRSKRPRVGLRGVAVFSGLATASVSLPLQEQLFVLEQWLPLQSVLQRILGYTVAAGMLDALLKMAVLHYVIYPRRLLARNDAIAYAYAGAIGSSFAVNFMAVGHMDPTWQYALLTVLLACVAQLVSSLFIALGLIESVFSKAMPLVLPANVLLGSAAAGTILALYPGFLSGELGTGGSGARPLFALGFLMLAWCLALALVAFFYRNSERRAREAYVSHSPTRGIEARASRAGTVLPRQRWAFALSYLLLLLGLLLGLNLRDNVLHRVSPYSNVEAGIAAEYPAGWLLDELPPNIFRVRDHSHPGYPTTIEARTLPLGPDIVERNLLDQLSLQRAQTLIDYVVLGYEPFAMPDDNLALSMNYAYIARENSPFLEGSATLVRGIDILSIRRGNALVLSYRADARIFEREYPTLLAFLRSLEA